MKRKTSAADVKRMAALQQENAKLRQGAREQAGRTMRAEWLARQNKRLTSNLEQSLDERGDRR